jgi:hypothetical protein
MQRMGIAILHFFSILIQQDHNCNDASGPGKNSDAPTNSCLCMLHREKEPWTLLLKYGGAPHVPEEMGNPCFRLAVFRLKSCTGFVMTSEHLLYIWNIEAV